jgi:hypothetical protein
MQGTRVGVGRTAEGPAGGEGLVLSLLYEGFPTRWADVGVHYLSAYRIFGRGCVQKETEKILREEEGRGS